MRFLKLRRVMVSDGVLDDCDKCVMEWKLRGERTTFAWVVEKCLD